MARGTRLERGLAAIQRELIALRAEWALVGGLAVSLRTTPRTTRDIDLAVAVATDGEAERLVFALRARGYRVLREFEQEATERLATVQLAAPGEDEEAIRVDLLFATAGIEPEVVYTAETYRVFRGLVVPVARISSLIALKTLSQGPEREQDSADLLALLRKASEEEVSEARTLLDLITTRGFHRSKRLQADLEQALALLRELKGPH